MTKNSTLVKLLALVFSVALFATGCGADDAVTDVAENVTEAAEEAVDAATGNDDEPAAEEPADEPEEAAAAEEVEMTDDHGGNLLDEIQARGELNCGVSGQAVAFSVTQADGSMEGFDADYCRVVAAAIFGDADAVSFVPLTAAERFEAVNSGAVDLLMRNTTWTQSRDTDLGMDFGPTTYFDGQQIMARVSQGFSADSTVADLEGTIVCTNAGTTTEKNITDAAAAAGVNIELQTFETSNEVFDGFVQGSCDIFTTDGSALVGRKAEQQPPDQEWVIFPPQPISKEPLGPTYPQNQSRFADVVNWAVYATFIADEYGVTSANAAAMAADPPTAEIGRLLGGEGQLQTAMGLDAAAFLNVIEQVGNYDEIYERNLVPVGLKREGSANAQYFDGGLIYAPPAR